MQNQRDRFLIYAASRIWGLPWALVPTSAAKWVGHSLLAWSCGLALFLMRIALRNARAEALHRRRSINSMFMSIPPAPAQNNEKCSGVLKALSHHLDIANTRLPVLVVRG